MGDIDSPRIEVVVVVVLFFTRYEFAVESMSSTRLQH